MSLKDQKEIIIRQKRCVRCFSERHDTATCTTNFRCRKCQVTHHTALCDQQQTRFAHKTVNGSSAITTITVSASYANVYTDLVVKTATVLVVGLNGKETRAILFVDDGSHRSWVTRSISKFMKLKNVAVENFGTRVFKQREPNPIEETNVVEVKFRGTWQEAPNN